MIWHPAYLGIFLIRAADLQTCGRKVVVAEEWIATLVLGHRRGIQRYINLWSGARANELENPYS